MASNPSANRPLPRRRPLNPPVPSQPPSQPTPPVPTTVVRPGMMPTRSQSTLTSTPPYDGAKSDAEAVDDVITQVADTGSLERAARKLSLFAKLNGGPGASGSRGSPSPHRGTVGGVDGERKSEVKRPGQEGYYDPEEDEIARKREDECAVDDDEEEEEGDVEMDGGDGGRDEVEEIVHLQEIVEGMWVGDLVAAMDSPGLVERGITNIVSLLRPRLSFPSNFSVLPLEIDDSPDTDILSHLPSCVSWIGEALRARERSLITSPSAPSDAVHAETERDALIRNAPPTTAGGVLIHCQAGMSRSATVAASYLMAALGLSPADAVDMIRERRPVIDPSETFLHQLALFHKGDGKVTLRDRSTRHFYMERNAGFFMNGQTSSPATDKMAKYPATPTPSQPSTPSGGQGRRKIRCKMCRRFLAVREHMMDHILDQAPLSRPRTPSNFSLPAPAHRLSISSISSEVIERSSPMERRTSVVSDVINPLTGLPGATRRSSMSTSDGPLSPLSPLNDGGGSVPVPRASTPGLVLTAMTPLDASAPALVESPAGVRPNPIDARRSSSSPASTTPPASSPSTPPSGPSPPSAPPSRRAVTARPPLQTAEQLASRLPPHLQALRGANSSASIPGSPAMNSPTFSSPPSSPEKETTGSVANAQPGSGSGSGSSSLEGNRPASRRKSMLSMTPAAGSGSNERRPSSGGSVRGFGGELANTGTPILVNQKCSGYFVEPLTWMEPVLKTGQISGKLVCPNEKCGAKIGNFDWAGVQCGCKEWVTPGFCISRSKVDEVW